MSIIVLQNTLILANGEMEENMKILSACSTFAIIVSVFILIAIQLIKYLKKLNKGMPKSH